MTRIIRGIVSELVAGVVLALLISTAAGCAFAVAACVVLPIMAAVRWM